jgi:O-antigen ligase
LSRSLTSNPRARSSANASVVSAARGPARLRVTGVRSHSNRVPPPVTEYAYYLVLFYGMLAPALGIGVPYAAGGLLLLLAAFCASRLGNRARAVFAPLKLLLGCAVSFLVVDVIVHGGSLLAGTPRMFITWILGIVIVSSLCLRPGFPHRLTRVLWVMGLSTLPFLISGQLDMRASVDTAIAGDFNNPNGLGGWFGFCCIYFTVLAIDRGRPWVRAASSVAAVICLYIVGLSVSRGALLGTTVGLLVAVRRLLGRGFVPVLVLSIVAGSLYLSGLFDPIVSRYAGRATQETGRFLVWPEAFQRFVSSPLLGVGAAHVETYVPSTHEMLTPHNTFLWFGLASGVVSLLLFIAWWVKASRTAVALDRHGHDGQFRLPLLMHTLVITAVGDLGFMQPWGILAFCVAVSSNAACRYRAPVRNPVARQAMLASARRVEAGAFIEGVRP